MPGDDDWLEGNSGPALIVDRADLAVLLGLAPKEIDRLIRDGLPTHGARRRGQPLMFKVPEVVRWLLSRGGDTLEEAKRKQALATARKREVEAGRMEGEYVLLKTVVRIIRDEVEKLRSELLTIPLRLPAEVRAAARAEVEGAINRLSFDRATTPAP
jgi:phage terminase Nu1 subunit (DNA packaging protein)